MNGHHGLVDMLLLDTCSLLWLVSNQQKLSKAAITTIIKYTGNIYISAISAFEIGVKNQKRLLELPCSSQDWFKKALEMHGLIEIPISSRIALASVRLPTHHSDPCDRIIIATAQEYNLKIVTPDQHIATYPEAAIIW